eukprot:SAG11_NODE_2960_length_2809_cov_3.573063_1_plen_210_part_00
MRAWTVVLVTVTSALDEQLADSAALFSPTDCQGYATDVDAHAPRARSLRPRRSATLSARRRLLPKRTTHASCDRRKERHHFRASAARSAASAVPSTRAAVVVAVAAVPQLNYRAAGTWCVGRPIGRSSKEARSIFSLTAVAVRHRFSWRRHTYSLKSGSHRSALARTAASVTVRYVSAAALFTRGDFALDAFHPLKTARHYGSPCRGPC